MAFVLLGHLHAPNGRPHYRHGAGGDQATHQDLPIRPCPGGGPAYNVSSLQPKHPYKRLPYKRILL